MYINNIINKMQPEYTNLSLHFPVLTVNINQKCSQFYVLPHKYLL